MTTHIIHLANPFDFQGIPFLWGGQDPRTGLDCWGLARHIHLTLTGKALQPFPEVYSDYPTAESAPSRLMSEKLLSYLGPPLNRDVESGDVVCIKTLTSDGLGTVISSGAHRYVVFTTPSGSRVQTLQALRKAYRGPWDLSPLEVTYDSP